MKIIKSIGWTTIATLATVISSLSFYKIFSIFFGPPGIAIMSHIQNLVAITTTLPHQGINRGTTKFLSGVTFESPEYKNYFFTSAIIQFLIYLISIPFLYIIFQQTQELPEFIKSNFFIGAFFIAIFFQLIGLFFFSILLSAEKLKLYASLSIINNIICVVGLYLGLLYNIEVACLAVLFCPSIISILLFFNVRKMLDGKVIFKGPIYNKAVVRDLSQFLLIAGCSLVFSRIADYFVRIYIVSKFDVYQAGLWQSSVKLSDGYSSLFTGILGALFFPKMAGILNNNGDIQKFFSKMTSMVMPAVVVGLLMIYFLKNLIMTLVFNSTFIEAGPYLNFQLIGDFFKFFSWLMVYLVLARAKTKIYILLEIFSLASYLTFLTLFQDSGPLCVSYAYVGRYLIYFSMLTGITIYYFYNLSSNKPIRLS